MSAIPPEPEHPEQRGSAPVHLRYEEVAQDGRVTPGALPYAFGEVNWKQLLARHPVAHAAREAGIIPIVSRFVMESEEGPFSIAKPLQGEGSFQLAHTLDARGEVARLMLLFWLTLRGPKARMHGPPPPDAGTIAVAGRAYAEHVFSRPFAAREGRKVTSFAIEGLPRVPAACVAWRAPDELLVLPEGAEALDAGIAPDDAPTAFGLFHTDSNQHVNSLVYPRLFEEAALRRLAALGMPTALLARSVEITYRKPCFAGERARVVLRAFRMGEGFGAVGAIVSDALAHAPLDPSKAHAFARIVFAR